MIKRNAQCLAQAHYTSAIALITDISSYPSFVPWCKSVKLTSAPINTEQFFTNSQLSPSQSSVFCFGYGVFNVSYPCVNELSKTQNGYRLYTKAVNCDSSPFQSLQSIWQINPLGQEQTQIIFDVEYKLKNFVLQKTSAIYIDSVMAKIIEAFKQKLRPHPQIIFK